MATLCALQLVRLTGVHDNHASSSSVPVSDLLDPPSQAVNKVNLNVQGSHGKLIEKLCSVRKSFNEF